MTDGQGKKRKSKAEQFRAEQLQRMLQRNPDLGEFAAGLVAGRRKGSLHGFAGRPLQVSRFDYGAIVAAAFGTTARGTPDAAAAGRFLNVHPATVRRWIRTQVGSREPSVDARLKQAAVRAGFDRSGLRALPNREMSVSEMVAWGYGDGQKVTPAAVRAAAKAHHTTPAAVRGWIRRDHIPKLQVHDQMAARARRHGAQIPAPVYDVHGMLLARYGMARNGRGLNIKAAAADLGITPGVIRGWLHRGYRGRVTSNVASQQAAQAFDRLVSQAPKLLDTQQGRRRVAQAGRSGGLGGGAAAQPPAPGGGPPGKRPHLFVSGRQGLPDTADGIRQRNMRSTGTLTDDEIDRMYAQWEDRGVEGFADWLQDQGDKYLPGWEFEEIDDIYFGDWE